MSSMNLSQWLINNQLSDLQKISSMITLEGLLNLNEQDTRSICSVVGLESQEIDRLINALNKEKPKQSSQQIHNSLRNGKFDANNHDAISLLLDGYIREIAKQINTQIIPYEINQLCFEYCYRFPVIPLLIPDNYSYDPNTNKMQRNHSNERIKLNVYEPALEFIRSIRSKIATISIIGRPRTGKSFIASELYAPNQPWCPFELGGRMNPSFGIWISDTIKHPQQRDTIILILDVDGIGWNQNIKQHDDKVTLIAFLISSYVIYNSNKDAYSYAFDETEMDEISFIAELPERIQSTVQDDTGQDFCKFFPSFMWLWRDVHLLPVIENRSVSWREYFIESVLKKRRGISMKAINRQWIQTVFLQMFPKYDAFGLSMPGYQALQKGLDSLPRSQFRSDFNQQLQQFTDKVLNDVEYKVLFSKNEDNAEHYTICTGMHLAKWIEECVEAVNVNEMPIVTTMTSSVVSEILMVTKEKALKEYERLLCNGLLELRHWNDKQPLDEYDIIELHLKIFDQVMMSYVDILQPIHPVFDSKDANYQQFGEKDVQINVFRELCDEIGHHDCIREIGKKGILYDTLSKNTAICKMFKTNGETNECNEYVVTETTKRQKALQLQKELFDRQIERIKKVWKIQEVEQMKILKQAEIRIIDIQSAWFSELVQGLNESITEMNDKLVAKQRQKEKNIKAINQKCNQMLETLVEIDTFL